MAALENDWSPLEDDYTDDNELPTNRLHAGSVDIAGDASETSEKRPSSVDWLSKLSSKHPTEVLFDDLPPSQPAPSGMSQHTTPARIAPTAGARLTTGLRRGVLLAIVSSLAVAAVLAGGYALLSTTWLSSVFEPAPSIAQQQPALPRQTLPQPPAQSEPQQPATGSTGAANRAEMRDRGIEEYQKGNYAQAIDLFQGALIANDNDAVTYYQLGLAFVAVTNREHSLDDAEMAFRTAISLQPTWVAPQMGLAESLLRRGYYKEAIAPALQATNLGPQTSEAWLTLGRAYQGAGQQAEATRAFAQAARLSPAPPQQP